MKKLICSILLLTSCLFLFACNNMETANSISTEPVATTVSNTTEATAPEPTHSEGDLVHADHPLLNVLYGDWVLRNKEDPLLTLTCPCTSLSFRDDRTCTVDGKDARWSIRDDTNDAELHISVFNETGDVCHVVVWKDTGTLHVSAEHNPDMWFGVWARPFETITVTVNEDNWDEYFEIITYEDFRVDGFGENGIPYIIWSLALKPEYRIAFGEQYSLFIEFSFTPYLRSCSIDSDTGTIVLSGTPEYREEEIRQEPFLFYSHSNRADPGSFYIATPDSLADYKVIELIENIEILRFSEVVTLDLEIYTAQ